MAIQLFEHNKTAYSAALTMLAERGKAAVIHPTGAGKSFIGFKLCEDNPEKPSAGFRHHDTYIRLSLKTLQKQVTDISLKTSSSIHMQS